MNARRFLRLPAAALALGALAMLPAGAHAQRVSKITGGQLLSICTNPKGQPMCDAYIAGVGDGIAGIEHTMGKAQGQALAGSVCIPDEVSAATMRSTVTDYIRGHRDLAGKPAAVPTFEALHATYACSKSTP